MQGSFISLPILTSPVELLAFQLITIADEGEKYVSYFIAFYKHWAYVNAQSETSWEYRDIIVCSYRDKKMHS